MSARETIKLLFLSANPRNTTRLQIDEEIRAIDQTLRMVENGERFELYSHWAVRYSDLQELLLRYNPHIVHFSGHGSNASEIVLQDDAGTEHPVSVNALSTLFSLLKDNIHCVVLNVCYSEQQAQAIAQHIEAVVGISNKIGDQSAIQFSAAFYRALGYGRSIQEAFNLGCNAIDLANLADKDKPQLLTLHGDPEKLKVATPKGDKAKDVRVLAEHTEELTTQESLAPQDHYWAERKFSIREYFEWIQEKAKIVTPAVPLTAQKQSTVPDILNYTIKVGNEASIEKLDEESTLVDIIHRVHQIAIVGESGSGKSTALWQLALHQCQGPLIDEKITRIPVYIDLAGYRGGSVTNLICQSLEVASQSVTDDVIEIFANEGKFLLLLDDFDLAKTVHISGFLQLLKKWRLTYPRCAIVVATHRPQDGHRLDLPTFRLQPLSEEQARQVLSNFPALTNTGVLAIMNSFPSTSRHLVENPLTLHMVAYLYIRSGRHQVPRSSGLLYREVTEGIMHLSEAKGMISFERSDKFVLLSLIARWMLDNETYILSPAELSSLIRHWISDGLNPSISHLQNSDLLELRTELLQSGFFQVVVNGERQFVHSTFRDYFAAQTISPNELHELINKHNWHTSFLLWSSITTKRESDRLVELLVSEPLLLAQLMRERTEKRQNVNLNTLEEKAYFERLGQYFLDFVTQFPILTRYSPLDSITERGVTLMVAKSLTDDYVVSILWRSHPSETSVEWVTSAELRDLTSHIGGEGPLPIWLLPASVTQKYHPLEAVYLWTRRTLFDMLTGSVSGGVDETQFDESRGSHPAVALITNRFLLYQAMASELPASIRTKLPFYADKEYELAIEVHNYMHPYIAYYTVMPARNLGKVAIIQSILKDADQTPMFIQDGKGSWEVRIAGESRRIAHVEIVEMPTLMIEAPGFWATRQLMIELERNLPGFPPEAW